MFLANIGASRTYKRRLVTVAFALLLCVAGCQAEDQTSEEERQASPVLNWQLLVDSLDMPDESVDEMRLPLDVKTHPQARFESFEVRAVLLGDDGQHHTVSGQIDRLKVSSANESTSAWAFNSVARAQISTGSAGEPALITRDDIARVSLGLAASQGNKIFVKDTRLTISPAGQCKGRTAFTGRTAADTTLNLIATTDACPEFEASALFNQWEHTGIPVEGRYGKQSLAGTLWLTHRWGSTVSVGGAVVIDQIRIKLFDNGSDDSLFITRTKRRSGRGPKPVSVRLLGKSDMPEALDVEWSDEGAIESPTTGLSYAESIRLKIPSLDMELVLAPIVTVAEIQDAFGTRWAGGMTVSGSHEGVGFVDIQSIEPTE